MGGPLWPHPTTDRQCSGQQQLDRRKKPRAGSAQSPSEPVVLKRPWEVTGQGLSHRDIRGLAVQLAVSTLPSASTDRLWQTRRALLYKEKCGAALQDSSRLPESSRTVTRRLAGPAPLLFPCLPDNTSPIRPYSARGPYNWAQSTEKCHTDLVTRKGHPVWDRVRLFHTQSTLKWLLHRWYHFPPQQSL